MVSAHATERARRIRVIQQGMPLGAWELAIGEPDRRLQPYVTAYHGYVERMAGPVRGRELPSTTVPLIINFGAAYRMSNAVQPNVWATHGSFLAGLHDVAAFHESGGSSDCLQVNFTPIGAYRFFGVAMGGLVNRVVDFEDLLGSAARSLTAMLYESPSWDSRFAIMDRFIAGRIETALPVDMRVDWVWRQIEQASGCVAVTTLSEEIGWSRKHLVERFREQIGMPPKQISRILRFERAMRLVERDRAISWIDLAHRCGYYDQSHLIRDMKAFAGCTPTELFRDWQVTSVQDTA